MRFGQDHTGHRVLQAFAGIEHRAAHGLSVDRSDRAVAEIAPASPEMQALAAVRQAAEDLDVEVGVLVAVVAIDVLVLQQRNGGAQFAHMLVDPVERGRRAKPAVAPAQSAPVMRKVELPGLAGREVDGEHLLVVERVATVGRRSETRLCVALFGRFELLDVST